MNKIEKTIFRIDEDEREHWLFKFVINQLFDINSDTYLMIYKKNKIDENIETTLINLIQIGDIHMNIVNSLDNTFMITKKNSEIIFNNLRTLIYKYKGFE